MMTIPDLPEEALPPCPACKSQSWRKAGQAKDYSVSGEWFELRECNTCGLRMTYPHPDESEIGRYYASLEYISHSDTRKGLTNKLYHAARQYMLSKKFNWVCQASGRNQGTLLDVGAGTGHFAHYMQAHGWNVVALEPDSSARKVALDKLEMKIEPLEILAIQQPHSYDVITLWHVMEHVYDLNGYMDHFRTILKPDGVLMIAVPNYTSFDASRYGAQWAAYDVPRHLWHFSPGSMEKLMTLHHFSLVQKTAMPLDAFYVSMLSEKYKGNGLAALPAALYSGFRTFWSSRHHEDHASSIIYSGKPAE